ncbi:MAG: uracil-DNA glycosylase [Humibacillus sp.]|nr:uracil-DNA glycosylase [Humibacillus sp.]MDN5776106.1 uracil-DNA glycosylase [Humibacillus sp.]
MSDDFGDEAYHLLVEAEGPDAAAAAVGYVRQQRRLRSEPTMSRDEAIGRSNDYLRAQGSPCVANAKAHPNGLKDLWLVECTNPGDPNVRPIGNAPLVVTAAGDVYGISSTPGHEELIGIQFPPVKGDAWALPQDWNIVLHDFLQTPRWSQLMDFVDRKRETSKVYPAPDLVFHALELTPYQSVRVVILGQDPYHGAGQAHGLSFSVAEGTTPPPSLRRILDELEFDLNVAPPQGGNLESWARQGVLLLNTILTVDAGSANSHKRQGWEEFTDAIIGAINAKSDPVVFLLWGDKAQKKSRLITNPKHQIITAAHPAHRPNARQTFAKNDPSRAQTMP